MTGILLTRSVAQNKKLLQILSQSKNNWKIFQAPMLESKPLKINFNDFTQYNKIIITSKYAAEILQKNLSWKADIYIIGQESANLIKHNDNAQKIYIFKSVELMQKYLKENIVTYNELIYFSGNVITKDISSKIKRQIIYQVDYITKINQETTQAINDNKINYILFYSLNSAKQFIKIAQNNNLLLQLSKITAITLSNKIGNYCKSYISNVLISDGLSNEAMINKIEQYEARKI